MQALETDRTAIRIAASAATLYLLNILLLPGLGFLLLLILFVMFQNHSSKLVHNHLQQALRASVYAGLMLILVGACILLFGDLAHVGTWIFFILYILCVHSVFILLGVVALTRALAGQLFFYPLFGRRK
jgi:uncharacterized Tic20 family protein